MAHRVEDDGPEAFVRHGLEVRDEVVPDAFGRALQRNRVDGEDDHQGEQQHHHVLRDALDALPGAEIADEEPEQADEDRPEDHLERIAQHGAEPAGDLFGRFADEGAVDVLEPVVHHPAGNGGVIHHQQGTASDGHPAEPVPFRALGFQSIVGEGGAPSGRAADGELRRHDRDAEDDEEEEVDEHEDGAAVLPADVRELPDVADADGAARGHQDVS